MSDTTVIKRGPGRPPKVKPEGEEPKKEFTFKVKPNWDDEDFYVPDDESPDRLRIPPEMIPDGYVLQWVTDSVYGQPTPQRRAMFERGGWTQVYQSDFDGRFDGMFMAKGQDAPIVVDGVALMYRLKEHNDIAKRRQMREAREPIDIKERAIRGGDLPGVTLDAQHKTAIQSNKVGRSYERIDVPKDATE